MNSTSLLFNHQFLLTRDNWEALPWRHLPVAEYHLYSHPHLEVSSATNGTVRLILIGFFFDSRYPEKSNTQILESLLAYETFEDILHATDAFSGRFVCIYQTDDALKIFHDAAGQREVFYDTTFSAFGSQPKLIETVIPAMDWSDPDAIAFFQSDVFLTERMFVGDLTHRQNIKRLLPNHYADLRSDLIHRFFPDVRRGTGNMHEVATQAITMIKGFMKAASLRYTLDIGITAGNDSRILFLASLDLECDRFVERNKRITNADDVEIALKLGKAYQKIVEVRDEGPIEGAREIHDRSIDFPRYWQSARPPSDKLIIHGHTSEIAKNFFKKRIHLKTLQQVTGADLATMYKFDGIPFVIRVYDAWINKNRVLFQQTGYDYLDLFYWEERMGNWSAKGKTEVALSTEVYSPFCSRSLLRLLLSVDKTYRKNFRPKLFEEMIFQLSPDALKIPINPNKKRKKDLMLKRLGLYAFDKKYGIISKILRHQPFK